MAGKDLILDFSEYDVNHVIADQEEIRRYNLQRYEMEQLTAVIYADPERGICAGYKDLTDDRRLRNWDNLERAYREGLVVSGRVVGRIKGGLSVDVGVPAFMPGSQIDTRPTHNLDSLLGQASKS